MVDTFNFECKFRESKKVKVVDFQTSDGTEWKLSEEWLETQRREKTIVQRIIFYKQNYYDRRYIINMEITSLTNLTAGKIQITKDSGPVFSRIIIPLDQFRVFRYSVGFQYTANGVYIYGRVLTDRFRYKVTISRVYVLQNEGDRQEIPERDKLLMFSDQIHWLLETGHFSDAIVTNGHFQIRAHRNILSARSEYFRIFFACKMMEFQDAVVYISDVSEEIVKELLHFIYSGTVRLMKASTALELVYLAEMYLLLELKVLCCKVLERNINVDSVVDILCAAYFLNEPELEVLSTKFILDNFVEVQASDSWADLDTICPTLFNEIIAAFQARQAVHYYYFAHVYGLIT